MKRKWLLGIGRALLALALTSVLLVLTVSLLLSLLTAREERSLLGLRAMIVRSDSMSATDFAAGDLILSVAVDPEEIREGDVITFRSPDPEQGGATVTHKVRTVLVDANGKRSFVTYGTTTGEADRLPVPSENLLGRYWARMSGVGPFFSLLQTPVGFLCLILLPFLALVLLQLLLCFRALRRMQREREERWLEEWEARNAALSRLSLWEARVRHFGPLESLMPKPQDGIAACPPQEHGDAKGGTASPRANVQNTNRKEEHDS